MDTYVDPAYYRAAGCSRCGTGNKLIDTDVHIDYEGPLALCVGCLADLARKAGHLVGDGDVSRLAAAEADRDAARLAASDAEATLFQVKSALARIDARKAATAAARSEA